jgi:hypothetical protein
VTVTDPAGNVSPGVIIEVKALIAAVAHPVVYPGDEQVITGYNFNAGERVDLVIYSDPFAAGWGVADRNGTVTITFVVPDGMEYGQHTATMTGSRSGSVSTTFEVAPRAVAPQEPQPVLPFVPTGGEVVGTFFDSIAALI